jgi:hypothetical protein
MDYIIIIIIIIIIIKCRCEDNFAVDGKAKTWKEEERIQLAQDKNE